jgi:CarD family transcriptional regulator
MKHYEIGEYLMHESAGVCQVAGIQEMALQGKGSEKLYYSLKPVYTNGSHVITPVDAVEGTKIRIRDVKSAEEIEDLMEHLDDVEVIHEKNDRVRQELFKEQIALFDPRSLAGVVKTAYLRKMGRIASGKEVMSSDEKILQSAGKKLFQEMAFALDEEPTQIEDAFFEGLTAAKEEYVASLA